MIMDHCMDHCIPQLTLKSKKNLPWLTKSVVQAIRKRNALFRAAKNCKSTASYQKYRAARNKVVAFLHLNKNRSFKRLGYVVLPKKKEFWKAIKLMNKQESSIPTLSNNSEKVESSYDKAVLLNSYFHQCFNMLVPPLDDRRSHLNPSSFPVELLCTEDVMFDMITELDCNNPRP